jgi:hypothetical protein
MAHQHAQNYSTAWEAYLKIKQAYGAGPKLPQLCLVDLCISTAIVAAAEVSQCNTQLPWIWSFGTTVDKDGTWMDDCEIEAYIHMTHTNLWTS